MLLKGTTTEIHNQIIKEHLLYVASKISDCRQTMPFLTKQEGIDVEISPD